MPQQPPKYKTVLIIWMAIYPLITGILWAFGPYLVQIPLMLRTLILTGVLVPIMVYLAIPTLQKAFKSWLES
ncbi:MAG: hypothetical protein AAF135_19995 [Bacteroidota bacterium]